MVGGGGGGGGVGGILQKEAALIVVYCYLVHIWKSATCDAHGKHLPRGTLA